MRSARTVPLAMLIPLLLGAESGTLLSREPDSIPARLLGPLPARLDPAALTNTELLRSLGLMRLPQFRSVRQRLCRGDAAERARFRDGVARAAAEPGVPLRSAYYELAAGCENARDHCEWLAAEADRAAGAAAELFWSALAVCWPLDEPDRFERADAPDDAVVSFHSKRMRTDRVHSARLAAVVDRKVATGEASIARDALDAYSRMDHPATAEHLLRLRASAANPELRSAVIDAMRNQKTASSWDRSDVRPDEETREALLDAAPGPRGRRAWLMDQADFQFGDHTGLLRELADLLRPELDDAYFDDVWPAVDAVSLSRGPHPVQTFVDGDALTVGVPDRDGVPDLALADAIRDELTAALREPRVLEVWWRGERLRFEHHGVGDDYDVDAALAVANFLLEEAGSTRRVASLATGFGLAVVIAPSGR